MENQGGERHRTEWTATLFFGHMQGKRDPGTTHTKLVREILSYSVVPEQVLAEAGLDGTDGRTGMYVR